MCIRDRQSNLDERTVYSLRIKNNDQIVHSDFVPAKHEVILQKNVHLVKVASKADAVATETSTSKAVSYTHLPTVSPYFHQYLFFIRYPATQSRIAERFPPLGIFY